MSDEFDPSAAAARALGETMDGEPAAAGGGAAEDAAAEATGSSSTSSDQGIVEKYIRPLLTAPDAGPDHKELSESFDLDSGPALIGDGLFDYVADVAGIGDEGSGMPPVLKFGMGFSDLMPDKSSTSSSENSGNDGGSGGSGDPLAGASGV